jgi:2-dehydropantoate 2-reductase
MDFVIIGGGAIGGVMAAGLTRQGATVLLVDRNQAHVDAILDKGLLLRSPEGSETVRVSACLPGAMPSRLNRVLMAVKCLDTTGVLALIKPRLDPEGYVVSLQNGLNPVPMAEALGASRTIGAFVNSQAACTQPGIIDVGRQGTIHIGELDGRTEGRIAELAQLFNRVRPTSVTSNIMGFLWSKMAYSSIQTATALVDADVRVILPRYPDMFLNLAAEALRLAMLEGVRPESFDVWEPDEILSADKSHRDTAFRRILDSWMDRAIQRTGTWRDLAIHHRMPDVDAKIGLMLKLAEGRLKMPLNRRLLELVHEIAEGRRTMGWSNLDELARINLGG